jgi:hypothetical protein
MGTETIVGGRRGDPSIREVAVDRVTAQFRALVVRVARHFIKTHLI